MSAQASFKSIMDRACLRKGGEDELQALLITPLPREELALIPDDRALAAMARSVFQAGFVWSIIANKWAGFEEVFKGFDPDAILALTNDELDAIHADQRIVRNGQKIKSVIENARFIKQVAAEHGSFGQMIAGWDPREQIGLFDYMKKHGSRLGGNSGRWVLRKLGYDVFAVWGDALAALRSVGLDLPATPTSKRDLAAIQAQFNAWHDETGLPFTQLSQIAAFSCGANKFGNPDVIAIEEAIKNGDIPQI